MKLPKISLIIVTKNDAETIEVSLNSFKEQEYPNKELIVVDGKSTDGTVEIVKKHKIAEKIISAEPKGISDAFNRGVEAASGDYLYFWGSGDHFWKNDVLERMMTGVDPQKDMLVCGRINRVTADDSKVLYTSSLNFKKWMLLYKMGLPHQALFTNKKFFERYGLFDLNCKYAMDYELLLRAYKNFPEVILKDIVVAVWREGGIGMNNTSKVLAEYSVIRKKNKIAPDWVLNLINLLSIIRYSIYD